MNYTPALLNISRLQSATVTGKLKRLQLPQRAEESGAFYVLVNTEAGPEALLEHAERSVGIMLSFERFLDWKEADEMQSSIFVITMLAK